MRRGLYSIGFAVIVKQKSQQSRIDFMDLIGNVSGKDCILIDDMVDSGLTLN